MWCKSKNVPWMLVGFLLVELLLTTDAQTGTGSGSTIPDSSTALTPPVTTSNSDSPTSSTATSRPALDTSSKLSTYWLRTAITVTIGYNVSNVTFLNMLEDRLLQAYLAAKTKSSVGSRKRRAATSGTTSVQLVQASRTDTTGGVELIYYFNIGGVNVPAATAVSAMNQLSIAELSSIIGYPVKTVAEAYTASPLNSATNLWIIAAVLGPLAGIILITWFVLFIYITCVRPFNSTEVILSENRQLPVYETNQMQLKSTDPPTDSTVNLKDAMQVEYGHQNEKGDPPDAHVYPIKANRYSKALENSPPSKTTEHQGNITSVVNESYVKNETEERDEEDSLKKYVSTSKEKMKKKKKSQDSEEETDESSKKDKKKSKDKDKKKDKDKTEDSDESSKSSSKSKQQKKKNKKKKGSDPESNSEAEESELQHIRKHLQKELKKEESDPEEEIQAVTSNPVRTNHVPIRVMTTIRPEAFEAAKLSAHSWYAAGDEVHRLKPALEKDLQDNIQVIDVREVDPAHKRPISPGKDSEIILVKSGPKTNSQPPIIQVKPRTKNPSVEFSTASTIDLSVPSRGSEVRVIPSMDDFDENPSSGFNTSSPLDLTSLPVTYNQPIPRSRQKKLNEDSFDPDPVGTKSFNKDELDVVSEVMRPGASSRPLVESIRSELSRMAESSSYG